MENKDNLNSEQLDEVSGGINSPLSKEPRCSKCLSSDLTFQNITREYGYTVMVYKCDKCGATIKHIVEPIQN